MSVIVLCSNTENDGIDSNKSILDYIECDKLISMILKIYLFNTNIGWFYIILNTTFLHPTHMYVMQIILELNWHGEQSEFHNCVIYTNLCPFCIICHLYYPLPYSSNMLLGVEIIL